MGERREVCRWGYLHWPESESHSEGDCGVAWSMTEGGLKENGVEFCPRCGGAIEFIAPKPEPEDYDA